MSHPASTRILIWEDRGLINDGERFIIHSTDGYWLTPGDGFSSNRNDACTYTNEELGFIRRNADDTNDLSLEVLPPEGSAPAAAPEPTGEYQPPYPPAETIIIGRAEINAFLEAHPDRHFVVYDRGENTYWTRPEGELVPNGGGKSRDKAGVWLGSEMTTWGFGSCEVQMLPILGSIPPVAEAPLEEQTPGQALFSILNSNTTHSAGESLYGNKVKAIARLREVLKAQLDHSTYRIDQGLTINTGVFILTAMFAGDKDIIGDDWSALKILMDRAEARLAKAILPSTNTTKQQLAQAVAKTYNFE